MDIDKLNKEFNELIKKFDEKTITEWLEQKRLEDKEEKRNKRSKQLCECKMNKYIEINGRIQTCYKCGKDRK